VRGAMTSPSRDVRRSSRETITFLSKEAQRLVARRLLAPFEFTHARLAASQSSTTSRLRYASNSHRIHDVHKEMRTGSH
jgi:hypothetical protein